MIQLKWIMKYAIENDKELCVMITPEPMRSTTNRWVEILERIKISEKEEGELFFAELQVYPRISRFTFNRDNTPISEVVGYAEALADIIIANGISCKLMMSSYTLGETEYIGNGQLSCESCGKLYIRECGRRGIDKAMNLVLCDECLLFYINDILKERIKEIEEDFDERFTIRKLHRERVIKEEQRMKGGGEVTYLIQNGETCDYKIGITTNIKQRITSIQTSNPCKVGLVHYVESNNRELEKLLHSHFSKNNVHNEWFRLNVSDVDECKALMDEYRDRKVEHGQTNKQGNQESVRSAESPPTGGQGSENIPWPGSVCGREVRKTDS